MSNQGPHVPQLSSPSWESFLPSSVLSHLIFHFNELETLVRFWIPFNQGNLECWNWVSISRTKVTSFPRISCKSGPATAETHHGPWAHLRKACKNRDWFTSPLPGLPQSSAAPPSHCGCFREPTVRAQEPQRGEQTERPRENRNVEKKEGEQRESGGVRGWRGHKGSAGRSQSALCKQASSWSGQVAGGSPPRATGAVSRADNWWQECGICS